MNIKEELYKQCCVFIDNRLKNVNNVISEIQESLQSETKSSAGDKHETGRAMLQLEMEKAGQQLKEVQEMQTQLDRVNLESNTAIVHLGSIVKTNTGTYFISISKGQIKIGENLFFAISSQSPIGKLLLGKKANEVVEFRDQQIKIIEIL